MKALVLALTAMQAGPAANRLLQIDGSDTTAYAATDTIEVSVGQVVELIPEIVVDGTVLERENLWVHNVSYEYVSFEAHIGNDRFSADPIRVTGLQPGVAPIMVHWSTQAGGAIFVVFRVVAPDQPATPIRDGQTAPRKAAPT